MVTLKADNRRRVQLPEAKPGQVFIYEKDVSGTIITLQLVKKIETPVEVLDLEDLNTKTLAPRVRGEIDNASILRAIRADRDSR